MFKVGSPHGTYSRLALDARFCVHAAVVLEKLNFRVRHSWNRPSAR
jgi:hypothetical protein